MSSSRCRRRSTPCTTTSLGECLLSVAGLTEGLSGQLDSAEQEGFG